MPHSLDREETLELIHLVEDMVTLPDYFYQIQDAIGKSESSCSDLAAIIGKDQATTSMVLKIANSTYFNPLGVPVATLPNAIARLGFGETASIAMTMALFYGFSLRTGMANVRALWAHAYAVAVLCRQMAKPLSLDAEEMFVAGLLHDIGRVVFGLRVDLEYFDRETGALFGNRLIEKEVERFGLDHAEAGAEILRLWRFPPLLIEAVEKHHEPESGFLPAMVIFLANNVAHEYLPCVSDIDQVERTLRERFPAGVLALLRSEGLLNH